MTIGKGTMLGPYEIVDSLGAGGMGEVWRARDTRLDRQVAIKVLPEGFAQSEQFLQRFEREARAISSLNHPHICTLHDVGQDNGSHYLVMELIDGESLADRLKRGPLPLHEVLRVGRQIALALDAAHRQGVIHRDLKPGNIMLTKAGAKLLDFGLAKSAVEGGEAVIGLTSLPTEAKPLTTEGTILGTFQYMAPEQLEGLEADVRTDIFAFGAVLYEMATGRRAFEGESKTSLIAAIVTSQPTPISAVTPLTPPALDHVVRRCLEKDRDDRWQSAQDIASELQWISEAGSQAGVATPISMRRKNRERLAWSVAVVLAIALIALALTWYPRGAPSESMVASTIPPPAGTSLIPYDLLGLALSPDGQRLVFAAIEENTRSRLWVRSLDSFDARPIAGTEEASYPFWSPDGQHLGFFANGKLKRVDLRGGAPQTLADAPSGRGGDWGEDDTILFAPNIRTSIYRIPASGGTPVPITDYDEETETTHRWPAFLPDRQHFIYVSRVRTEGEPERGRLMLASLEGAEPRVLIEDSTNAHYVPGYLIFGRGTSLFAQPFDLQQLEMTGRPIPVVDRNVSLWEPKNLDVFTASDDGTIVFLPVSSRTSSLAWYDTSGRAVEEISEPSYENGAAISPDGRRVAVVRGESAEGPFDLWIEELAEKRATRITFGGEAIAAPVWSPDGSRIAFACAPSGVFDVCLKDLDHPGGIEKMIEMPNWTTPGSWSPDGSRFFFTDQNPQMNEDILFVRPDGDDPPELFLQTPFVEVSPIVSPDGAWLAYGSNETGTFEVFLRAASGASGQWQISRGGGSRPRWAKGGRELYFISGDGSLTVARIESVSPVRVSDPRKLFELPGEPYPNEPVFQDVSADGERVLLAVPTESRSAVGFRMIQNWDAGLAVGRE